MADMRLTVRVDFGSDRVLGPGKIRLLEAIKESDATGQISLPKKNSRIRQAIVKVRRGAGG